MDETNLLRETRKMNEYLKPLMQIQQTHAQNMTALLETISPTICAIKETSKWTAALESSVTHATNWLKEFEKTIELSKTIKNDPDYAHFPFLMAGLLPEQTLGQLSRLWIAGEKQKVKDQLYKITANQECQTTLVEHLANQEYFKKMEPILSQALWAHTNKKYALSIIVFYALIDGALSETFKNEIPQYPTCKNKECKKNIDKCPYCGTSRQPVPPTAFRITEKLKTDEKFTTEFFDLGGAINFIHRTYHLKRSPIAHGTDPEYYKNRDLSTILILALDSTSYIIEQKTETK